jgi:hypothetical protein
MKIDNNFIARAISKSLKGVEVKQDSDKDNCIITITQELFDWIEEENIVIDYDEYEDEYDEYEYVNNLHYIVEIIFDGITNLYTETISARFNNDKLIRRITFINCNIEERNGSYIIAGDVIMIDKCSSINIIDSVISMPILYKTLEISCYIIIYNSYVKKITTDRSIDIRHILLINTVIDNISFYKSMCFNIFIDEESIIYDLMIQSSIINYSMSPATHRIILPLIGIKEAITNQTGEKTLENIIKNETVLINGYIHNIYKDSDEKDICGFKTIKHKE